MLALHSQEESPQDSGKQEAHAKVQNYRGKGDQMSDSDRYEMELEKWMNRKRNWYWEEMEAGRWNIGKILAKAYRQEQQVGAV